MTDIFGRQSSKKASLELSINAIVIVVLAFVMLGLGLGFIKNQIGKAGETTDIVQEQVKQQIVDDLRESNKKLSFPADRIKITKNQKKDIAIGIKNVESNTLQFAVLAFTQEDENVGLECLVTDEDISALTDLEELELPACDDPAIGNIKYFYNRKPETLGSTETKVIPISITPKGDQQTYLASIIVLAYNANADANADEPAVWEYDSKTFFIEVTG